MGPVTLKINRQKTATPISRIRLRVDISGGRNSSSMEWPEGFDLLLDVLITDAGSANGKGKVYFRGGIPTTADPGVIKKVLA